MKIKTLCDTAVYRSVQLFHRKKRQ